MADHVNPIDEYIGGRIRMRRIVLDLTQTQIADALGVTFQQVQKYEKGKTRVSAGRLLCLCRLLRVRVGFFFDGAPQALGLPNFAERGEESGPVSLDCLSDFLASPCGMDLAKAFTRISDARLRQAIVALVQQLASPPAEAQTEMEPFDRG
jgi:transcriptional regulator with XRE-family HTH domain